MNEGETENRKDFKSGKRKGVNSTGKGDKGVESQWTKWKKCMGRL